MYSVGVAPPQDQDAGDHGAEGLSRGGSQGVFPPRQTFREEGRRAGGL